METNSKQLVTQTGVKFGIISSVATIAYSTIINVTGNQGNQALGWVNFIIFIAVLVFANKSFKEANKGLMSFGEGFKIGAFISLISTFLSSIYTYVYIKFIDEDFFVPIKEMQEKELAKNGMSDEQLEQTMEMVSKFMTPEIITGTAALTGVIGGLIVAAIVAAIMKKENTQF
jgi:uncharacterized membrane protein YczE